MKQLFKVGRSIEVTFEDELYVAAESKAEAERLALRADYDLDELDYEGGSHNVNTWSAEVIESLDNVHRADREAGVVGDDQCRDVTEWFDKEIAVKRVTPGTALYQRTIEAAGQVRLWS